MSFIFNGKLKALSRFSMVGILNTLIDFTVFTIFNNLFQTNYSASQLAGYSFGVINSFIFNKNWTFQKENANKKTISEFLQFIIINVIVLSITIIFMRIFVNNFELNVYVAKVIVTFIAQIINFFSYKLWVFK